MTQYLNEKFNYNSAAFVSIYDELPIWSAAFGLKLLDNVRMKKGMRILDVGPGTGFPLIELAQRLGKDGEAFGIDPWSAALKRIDLKIKNFRLKNIILVNGAIEDPPFPDNYFDLIVSNNGLNNVDNIDKALNECYRMLKPGGKLQFTYNLPGTMIEFYSVFEQVLKKEKIREGSNKLKQHIFEKRKPLEFVFDLLIKNDFKLSELTTDEFKYRFVDGSAFLNHYFIKFAFLESWKNIVGKNDMKRVFAEVEERLNKIAKNSGGLSLSIPFAFIECEK